MDAKARHRRTRQILISLGVFGGVITLTVFGAYFLYFRHLPISETPGDWGSFGDFVGGILNPIIGLLALIGLLWTIYQNQRELSIATEEMRKSTQALQKNNAIAQQQSRKEEIQRVIAVIDGEIKNMLSKQVRTTRSFDAFDVPEVSLEEYLKHPPLRSLKDHQIDTLKRYLSSLVTPLSDHISDLASYLSKYTEIADDTTYESYYIVRYAIVASTLSRLTLLPEEVIRKYMGGTVPNKTGSTETSPKE